MKNKFKGESHHHAKHSDKRIQDIRTLYATGSYTHKQIAETFKMSIFTINSILSRGMRQSQ
jgi:DNA-binding transcriptional regulator LsrR (DeoR family)